MATWIKSGDTMIGYQMIPERKKPVFGIMKGNQFVVYGQFHDKQYEVMGRPAWGYCPNCGAKMDGGADGETD